MLRTATAVDLIAGCSSPPRDASSLVACTRCIKLSAEKAPTKIPSKWFLFGKYALENGSLDPISTDKPHHVGLEITSKIAATSPARRSSTKARPLC